MTNSATQVALPDWDVTPGALGIYNHGNTCFLNAILQCLSNTDIFCDYFVNKKFRDIRSVSSTKQEVSEQLADLLESLWDGSYSPDISGQFKSTVSSHNVQYRGSSQHDAQEFLLWLLDRINEELNQSSKKKAKETVKLKKELRKEIMKESRPELTLAMCSGVEVYNRFQALYQSSLTCPNCGRHSNTYEPYLCLSLPVPQRSVRPVYITVVYLDDNPKQLKIALQMSVTDTVKHLRAKLAHELEVLPGRLILCQIYEDGFRNTYGDSQLLTDIHENDTVYAFETFPITPIDKPPSSYELIQILLVHVEQISAAKWDRFCSPQVIQIARDVDYRSLRAIIVESMGLAVSELTQAVKFQKCDSLFRVLVLDSGVKDFYLASDVEMPLYTEPVDRALATYGDDFGPAHVKFIVEWEPHIKDRFVAHDEDIVEEHQSVHKLRLGQQQPAHVTLDECLHMFTQEERLVGEDAWHCPFCHESRGTIKQIGLWSVPDLLVIHLKRFRQSGVKRNKLNVLVDFPVTDLQMGQHLLHTTTPGPATPGNTSYHLYAVTNHYGNMNGGHYTAFCKNPVDSRWYEFDDMTVKPLSRRDIVSRSAYLLFYQRAELIDNTRAALQSGTHWILSRRSPLPNPHMKRGDEVSKADSELQHCPELNRHGFTLRRNKRADIYSLDAVGQSNGVENVQKNYSVSLPINSVSPLRRESPHNVVLSDTNLRENCAADGSQIDQTSRKGPNAAVNVHSDNVSVPSSAVHSSLQQHHAAVGTSGRVRPGYRRSGSLDSTRNTGSSSGVTRPVASTTADNIPPQSLLNNQRAVNTQPEKGIVDLKIHSNVISKADNLTVSANSDSRQFYTIQSSNQKNNNTSNVTTNSDLRTNQNFSTQQQLRPSEWPPVQNVRIPWLTPQPPRKQYRDSSQDGRLPVDRQLSVPSTTRPHSQVVDPSLYTVNVNGSAFAPPDRSLPDAVKPNVDRPPLPGSNVRAGRVGRPAGEDRGTGATGWDGQSTDGQPPTVGRTAGRSEGRSEGRGLSHPGQPLSAPHHRPSSHTHHDAEAAVYTSGRRRQQERPTSYHESTHPPQTQYYTEAPSFKRDRARYPTIGRVAQPSAVVDMYSAHAVGGMPQHASTVDTMGEPRSRAPLLYDPCRYEDPSGAGTQDHGAPTRVTRYQPHLQMAKLMSRLVMQENQLLNERVKSRYLKESSV